MATKKKPTAKIGKKPSKKRTKKTGKEVTAEGARPARAGKTGTEQQAIIDGLEAKAKKGDKDAIAALTAIVKRYHKWRSAQAAQKAIAFGVKEEVKASETAFEDAIVAPLPPGAKEADAAVQLQVCQVKFQELQETKEAAKEKKSKAAAETKAAAEVLERAIGEGIQPTLPNMMQDQ